jgi:hypothetical protein
MAQMVCFHEWYVLGQTAPLRLGRVGGAHVPDNRRRAPRFSPLDQARRQVVIDQLYPRNIPGVVHNDLIWVDRLERDVAKSRRGTSRRVPYEVQLPAELLDFVRKFAPSIRVLRRRTRQGRGTCPS